MRHLLSESSRVHLAARRRRQKGHAQARVGFLAGPLSAAEGMKERVFLFHTLLPSTPMIETLEAIRSIASLKVTLTVVIMDAALPVGDLESTVGAAVSTLKVTEVVLTFPALSVTRR